MRGPTLSNRANELEMLEPRSHVEAELCAQPRSSASGVECRSPKEAQREVRWSPLGPTENCHVRYRRKGDRATTHAQKIAVVDARTSPAECGCDEPPGRSVRRRTKGERDLTGNVARALVGPTAARARAKAEGRVQRKRRDRLRAQRRRQRGNHCGNPTESRLPTQRHSAPSTPRDASSTGATTPPRSIAPAQPTSRELGVLRTASPTAPATAAACECALLSSATNARSRSGEAS
jgi:hypothetical protein